MGPDDHILPGAFEKTDKTLPVVVYEKDGTRRVVGEGTIEVVDGALKMSGIITDPKAMYILGFSLGPEDIAVVENPKFEQEKKDGR